MRNPNPRHWDTPGSTCPIKCTNPEMGEHYTYDNLEKKVTCPSCVYRCTTTFEASAFQDITVAQTVEKGAGTLILRNQKVKVSSDLMVTILSQSSDNAFKCTSSVVTKNRIVMSSKDINDDMFNRAALSQVKQFTSSSSHTPFLRQMRENGRVGYIVDHPTTDKKIDSCSFGNSKTRYRSYNNNLKDDGMTVVSKSPSVYITGKPTKKAKINLVGNKKVREEVEYFAAGNLAVTPQKNAHHQSSKQ